jgi:hypothetical protein
VDLHDACHSKQIERETYLIVACIWGTKSSRPKIQIYQAGDQFNCCRAYLGKPNQQEMLKFLDVGETERVV